MAAECGIAINCGDDILAAKDTVLDRFKEELDFLRSRPAILETQNYIFVHGGLPQKSLEDIKSDVLKFDNFMATKLCFDKYVVVGHWPVTLYGDKIQQSNPIINREKKIISIDGGCGLKSDSVSRH